MLNPWLIEIVVGIVTIVVAGLVIYIRRAVASLPPYRDVYERHMQADGSEIVHLECGHRLRLVRNRRASFPCLDCHEKVDKP